MRKDFIASFHAEKWGDTGIVILGFVAGLGIKGILVSMTCVGEDEF